MKSELIYFVFLMLIFNSNHLQSQVKSLRNSDTSYYFYKLDSLSNSETLIMDQIIFDEKVNKKEILDSIARFISNSYFIPKNKYYEGKRKISISIQGTTEINLLDRNYSIATVNIDDPDKICMGIYFQGSSGGFSTFLILVSNLFQPQLNIPLLDGVIFLYNNTQLKMMDHIKFRGIKFLKERLIVW
ncbi:MAG: hypothetical protein U5J96_13625 [Ignavibacteriaceae bacterium]|nr:hypothetical protein [Ignavibacteriaceae bacterium]